MFDTVCFFSKPGPITQEQLSTFLGIAEFPLPVICFIYMDYITDRIFRRKKRKNPILLIFKDQRRSKWTWIKKSRHYIISKGWDVEMEKMLFSWQPTSHLFIKKTHESCHVRNRAAAHHIISLKMSLFKLKNSHSHTLRRGPTFFYRKCISMWSGERCHSYRASVAHVFHKKCVCWSECFI